VDCEVAREALSARIDGEREPVPRQRVDEHLGTCDECRQWYFRAREETQLLRKLAGQERPPLTTVTEASAATRRRPTGGSPLRWALGAVGLVQVALAGLQAAGVAVGVPMGLHDAHAPMMSGHLLNESTAWSMALGVAMIVAALRPATTAGVSVVLASFSLVLIGYVSADAMAGAVTAPRVLSHLPVLIGAILAVLAHRRDRPQTPAPHPDEIVLPENASRGRRRGHLAPTDDSAA